ncbi:Bug family tripartite tricarboxylate transporter substrate binding protein [Humitalea sp. 24SJ18S-53]|uniref:Bug family tripartite tricarboxylate transporter substrate binding protein n=1 Tax=Humitalea sp. 24SJ18S-53 TaxID=3422307 RepID=UPI003D67DB5A
MLLPTRRAALAALAAPVLLPRAAVAQTGAWSPDHPVRLIVPFAPGGSQDVLGRLFAQALGPIVGQQVVIENRAGAGGILGAETVARTAPDGHTLLLATAGQLTIAKAIGRRLSYDPIADFTPVAHLTDSPVALLAATQLGVDTLPDLLARAKAANPPLPYASTGIGTNTHLIMEDLKAREGLQVEHIPYRGAAAAFNDLLAGRIALMFVSVPSVLGFGGGTLKVLGVTSSTRFPALPDVPTMTESAVPGFEASIWTGVSLPAGAPAPIVARWHAAFQAALATDLVKTRLDGLGSIPASGGPAEFGALLREDLARWQRVAAPLRIEVD